MALVALQPHPLDRVCAGSGTCLWIQVCFKKSKQDQAPLSPRPHRIFYTKAMAPHSRPLAWKIPWMEEPGGLQSMGLRRVGYD